MELQRLTKSVTRFIPLTSRFYLSWRRRRLESCESAAPTSAQFPLFFRTAQTSLHHRQASSSHLYYSSSCEASVSVSSTVCVLPETRKRILAMAIQPFNLCFTCYPSSLVITGVYLVQPLRVTTKQQQTRIVAQYRGVSLSDCPALRDTPPILVFNDTVLSWSTVVSLFHLLCFYSCTFDV